MPTETTDRTALRDRYKELFRTKPFAGWSAEELTERIRTKEAENMNQNVRPFLLKDIQPVYLEGKAYVVVTENGKDEYKTLDEAKIIAHKNEAAYHLKEAARLEYLLQSLTPTNEPL